MKASVRVLIEKPKESDQDQKAIAAFNKKAASTFQRKLVEAIGSETYADSFDLVKVYEDKFKYNRKKQFITLDSGNILAFNPDPETLIDELL